jgi:Transposase DDE domain
LVPNDSRASPFFAELDAASLPATVPSGSRASDRARLRFAEPPWNCQSPEWLALDRSLQTDDLVRKIARLVDEELDLGPVFASYAGRGSLPHRPDLLVKLVLYEHQKGRPRPTQWLEDLEKNKGVEWLTFGMKVPRSVLYEFRDRIRPFVVELNQQVIRTAIDEKYTDASAASLDGTFVAANASRHRLLSLKTVEERLELLDQEIAKNAAAVVAGQRPQLAVINSVDGSTEAFVVEAIPAQPEIEPDQQTSVTQGPSAQPTATTDRPRSFMARTKRGMWRQRKQYRKAQEILRDRNKTNTRRRKDKRKKPDQVRVAIGDPMAPFGRDKLKVFRPLYNVQTMTDLLTDFVFTFSVTPTLSDSGHLVPMIIQMNEVTRQMLTKLLADSGYPSGAELAQCEALNVEVFAPWNENSFTAEKRAKAGEDRQIRKDKFIWDPEISGYICPQGKSLTYSERTTKQKANGDYVTLEIYRADAADCKECPLKARCVHGNSGARTVRRQPHEELIDKMRERTATPEGKAFYRQRSCTVERRFADTKTYRGLERFSGRTLERAETQVGLTILAHNLVTLEKVRTRQTARENPQKVAV